MKIGFDYGNRLSKESKNANKNTIKSLTNSYPSHDFVIDRGEASLMFNNVRDLLDEEIPLINQLGSVICEPTREPLIGCASIPQGEKTNESSNTEIPREETQNTGAGDQRNSETVSNSEGNVAAEPVEILIKDFSEKLKGKGTN